MRQQIVRFAAALFPIAAATGAMAQGVNGFISGTVQSDPGVAISDVAIRFAFQPHAIPDCYRLESGHRSVLSRIDKSLDEGSISIAAEANLAKVRAAKSGVLASSEKP